MEINGGWDTIVFVSFLLINLAIGLYHGRQVKTMEDYALGGRNFSTSALVSTILATWIGGDYLFITLAEVYNTGLHYTIGCLGMVVCLLLNAYVFIPKMSEFLGSISVSESMGKLYGRRVRIISAISGTIASAGFVAVQFKVFGEILRNFVGLQGNMPIFLAAIIVTIYSAFGGIKSVTFTDLVQFLTFGVLILILGFVLWNDFNHLGNVNLVSAFSNPIFDYKQFLGFSNPKFWSLLLLFLLFSIPDINPTMFQRVSMGRNIVQVKRAFTIAAFLLMIILLGMAWIAFLLFSMDPNLNPSSLVHHIIGGYSHAGLKSFILIGIVAMCMSSADSNINASSVLLTHDFCHPLKIKVRNELFLSKLIAISLGIISVLLALLEYDLLPLVFMTQSFYIPIIDVPLILAILGFRTTTKSVMIGMAAGLVGVILWRLCLMDITDVDSIIPGSVANLIFLVASHYILKQPGGWVKTESVIVRRTGITLTDRIKNFRILEFCKQIAPKNELTYIGFGLFCLISTVGTMYSMSGRSETDLLLLYESMLGLSIGFLTYPIWPASLKKDTGIQILWYLSVFYLLIVCNTFFVLLSHFFHQQLVIFILNIIVVAIIIRWDAALVLIISGVYCATKFYHYKTGANININIEDNQFILYVLMLIGTVIIIFLKPKQQSAEVSDVIRDYLDIKNKQKQFEVVKLHQHRDEFISRLDSQCIAVFKTVHTQIDNLKTKLSIGGTNGKLQAITNELVNIVDKLKVGSEYLDNIVFQITDQIKLQPTKVNIKKFLYNLIDEYKKISGHKNLTIAIKFSTHLTDIYLDSTLMKEVLFDCIYHAIINSDMVDISMLLKDTTLEYDISSDASNKIVRDALEIMMVVKNSTLTSRELQKIIRPERHATISEIRSSEIQKIIASHYGKISLVLNKNMEARYTITLPARLKEIRPKKMDLPDAQLDEINLVNTLIINKVKETLQNIAVDLMKAGMTPVFAAKITKLSLDEIKQL